MRAVIYWGKPLIPRRGMEAAVERAVRPLLLLMILLITFVLPPSVAAATHGD